MSLQLQHRLSKTVPYIVMTLYLPMTGGGILLNLIGQGSNLMGFIKKITLSIILIILIPVVSTASDVVIFDSEKQFAYSKKCYDEKDYLAAIVEFKKFKELFPSTPKVVDADFFIGMSWYHGGKYGNAVKAFEEIIENRDFEKSESVRNAYFMLAQSHVFSGNPVMGEIVLDNFIKVTENVDEKDKARSRIGWIRFETAKWQKAKKIFMDISEQNRATYKVDFMVSQIEKTNKLEFKSPTIAGSLAVIPGAGYLYTARYQDAFISFLLNGALIYATYESFEHENYALGGLVSFVGFGFYSGSIYGSVSSAYKYNQKVRRKFINQSKNEMHSGIQLGALPDLKRNSLSLALRVQF